MNIVYNVWIAQNSGGIPQLVVSATFSPLSILVAKPRKKNKGTMEDSPWPSRNSRMQCPLSSPTPVAGTWSHLLEIDDGPRPAEDHRGPRLQKGNGRVQRSLGGKGLLPSRLDQTVRLQNASTKVPPVKCSLFPLISQTNADPAPPTPHPLYVGEHILTRE